MKGNEIKLVLKKLVNKKKYIKLRETPREKENDKIQ